MLLARPSHSLLQSSDTVLVGLSATLAGHTAPETHAAVIELTTGVHTLAATAAAELSALRSRLQSELGAAAVDAAAAGTYPLASSDRTRISTSPRYRTLAASLRVLARRDPTMALHVHVGVPEPEDAVRVLNRFRRSLPLLLALSANSPLCQGRESGFASTRTLIFHGFPRTGPPRMFADYADYIEAIGPLIEAGAIPDASYVWWDARLQPALGTVEVRVMDSQSSIIDSAPLIALVQSLARLELEGDPAGDVSIDATMLGENCFLAARDGVDALLLEPGRRSLVPVRQLIDELLEQCSPHAAVLGCAAMLADVARLARENGADRQRALFERVTGAGLMSALIARFDEPAGAPRSPPPDPCETGGGRVLALPRPAIPGHPREGAAVQMAGRTKPEPDRARFSPRAASPDVPR